MGVICFDSLHWHKPPLLPPPLLGIDERSESNYPRLEVCKRFAMYNLNIFSKNKTGILSY